MPDSVRAENLIRLGEYYPKLNFGFAGGALSLRGDLFTECCDRSGFTALEILPDQFHFASDAQKNLWNKRFHVIHCGTLLDSSLVRQIPEEEESLRREFLRTVTHLLVRMQQDSIPAGILDFGLSSILNDPEKKSALARLLTRLHNPLYRTGRILLLPLHLPCADPEMPEKVMRFLRELMISQLKVCLRIYPHEISREFSPYDLAGHLHQETASVQFRYHADSGNTLLRAHLVPWLRYFSRTGFTGPFLFCPFYREDRLASLQSLACSRLAEELRNGRSSPPERK
ncbi:MAG: hypothetical protein J6S58_09165 [Lentisphaeria bacterium]|nr:hypothetical protein [Lentisphaeria bacterium]